MVYFENVINNSNEVHILKMTNKMDEMNQNVR